MGRNEAKEKRIRNVKIRATEKKRRLKHSYRENRQKVQRWGKKKKEAKTKKAERKVRQTENQKTD